MNKLIEFNVPGGTVVVESQEAAPGTVMRGGTGVGRVTEKVGASLTETLSVIRPVAEGTLAACDHLSHWPEAVEVEFGLKFDVQVGAVIARTATEGSLRVKLVWKPK